MGQPVNQYSGSYGVTKLLLERGTVRKGNRVITNLPGVYFQKRKDIERKFPLGLVYCVHR